MAFDLAPANVSDPAMVADRDPPAVLAGVGDRAYWSPKTAAALAERRVRLVAPFRTEKHDKAPARSRRLSRVRWVIETAFGQVPGRFRVKTTWVRALGHLSHRAIRQVLGHTAAV